MWSIGGKGDSVLRTRIKDFHLRYFGVSDLDVNEPGAVMLVEG